MTRWNPRRRLTIAAACLALAASACAASERPDRSGAADTTAADTTAADTTASGTQPTQALTAVPAALQFSAPLVGGGSFDGAAVAGKPTVFWFWAPT